MTMKKVQTHMGYLIEELLTSGNCSDAAKRLPTGIYRIDRRMNGGLPIGLLGITGGPSEGKTTLALQISDGISEAGKKVFYFSTEMTDQKMAAIAVSRQSFEINRKKAFTSDEVIKLCNCGKISSELSDAINVASSVCRNISLYGCNSWDHTVGEIIDEVTEYKSTHDDDVCVVVDYLNELARGTEEERRMERKDFIDHVVLSLKMLSEELQIPVILLCAINRDNHYTGEVTLDVLKDTGRLEYNYDVVMALERKLTGTQSLNVRNVTLHILKQKDGVSGLKINGIYYAAYNYFDFDNEEDKSGSNSDNHSEESDSYLDMLGQVFDSIETDR